MQGWDGPPPRSHSQPGMFLCIHLPNLRPERHLGWQKWAFLPDYSSCPKHSTYLLPPSLGSPTPISPHAGPHLSVTFSRTEPPRPTHLRGELEGGRA